MAMTFWFSFFLMFYIFFGYPLLLVVWKYFTVQNNTPSINFFDDESTPSVEVILVVRNVSSIIKSKLESLYALDYPTDKFKVLIISDSSDDDTVKVIRQLNYKNLRCIDNNFKSSKSACLNQAIDLSNENILMLTDARQKHESQSLKYLVAHFKEETVGAVSGELVLIDPDTNDFSKGMDAYWRYEKFIRGLESDIGSVAGVTGAIYAMKREYFQPIPAETLLDDVLIPMDLILSGKQVKFESKAIAYDIPSDDMAREKIRKTRTLAGNWQLLELNPALLNPFKNSIWLQFISHKILRLISPFLIVVLFVSNLFIFDEGFLYAFSFSCQLLIYLLIFSADYFEPLNNIKILKMIRSFLVLMWFTWLGFWSFITRQHLAIWK